MPPCTELLAGWVNTYTQFRPKEKSPCEIHSPFTHLLSSASPFFDGCVEACIQMSASLLSALHSCFSHTASHLFLSELEEGSEAGVFSFVFDFWDSHKIGYKPLMLRRKGGNPPQKTTLSLLCAHIGFNIPKSLCMCAARWSKWVQALRSVKCRFLSRHICVSHYTPSCLGSQLWGLPPLAGAGRHHGPTGGDTGHLQLSRLHLS